MAFRPAGSAPSRRGRQEPMRLLRARRHTGPRLVGRPACVKPRFGWKIQAILPRLQPSIFRRFVRMITAPPIGAQAFWRSPVFCRAIRAGAVPVVGPKAEILGIVSEGEINCRGRRTCEICGRLEVPTPRFSKWVRVTRILAAARRGCADNPRIKSGNAHDDVSGFESTKIRASSVRPVHGRTLHMAGAEYVVAKRPLIWIKASGP